MRAIVSLVLATALVTTPLKMVFAQAEQQEAVSVQQNALPDSSGHRLIRVPPVTDNTARLWRNPSGRALLNTELADASLVEEGWFGDLSPDAKVGIVLLVIVLVAVAVYVFVAACAGGGASGGICSPGS